MQRPCALGRRDAPTAPWESPHDHLALYLHNGPEYLEGVLSAHKARVAPFNVNAFADHWFEKALG